MTDIKRKMLWDRLEIALNRLQDEPQYAAVCEKYNQADRAVAELLQRFAKEERIFIRHHYEDAVYQTNLELEAVYMQGLRDSLKLLSFLGAFHLGLEG